MTVSRRIFCFFCLFFCAFLSYGGTAEAAKETYEFFYNNPCASCHEEDQIHELFDRVFNKEEKEILDYEIHTYNVFQSDNKRVYEERLNEWDMISEENRLPVLIAGGNWIFGYEEIEKKIRSCLLDNQTPDLTESGEEKEAIPSEQQKAELEMEDLKKLGYGEEENVLIFFTTYSCKDCTQVKTYLKELAESEKFVIQEYNIGEGNGVTVLQSLFEQYEVEGEKQKVPAIFYGKSVLTGAENICKGLGAEIGNGKAVYKDLQSKLSGTSEQTEKTNLLTLFFAGLLAGFNPCSISMLLMLFSILLTAEASVLKNGLFYLGGKYVTYLGLGLGIYFLAAQIDQSVLTKAGTIVNGIMIVLFLAVAVLNLLDFWNVRKKEYGKIRMQLPVKLRKWNHKLIKNAGKTSGRLLPFLVLGLGIAISFGEFFCTGQLYMASILYMLRAHTESLAFAGFSFLVYVTAMCIPAAVFLVVIHKTRNTNRISEFMFRRLDVVKLATAILFFLYAAYFIL